MKTLLYTFRTFPLEDLNIKEDVFVFGKLKEDFEVFKEKVLTDSPDLIIGFALVNNYSRFEQIAINRFVKGKVNKMGKESYKLNFPIKGFNNINLSRKPTFSFCNWTMYKVAEFIEDNKLNTKLQFIHIKSREFTDLIDLIENYS